MKKKSTEEKKKSIPLSARTKEQLIQIIRGMEIELMDLNKAHKRALKYCASLRYALSIELDEKIDAQYWSGLLDDMIEEEPEPVPPGYKEPNPAKAKKKDVDVGYS